LTFLIVNLKELFAYKEITKYSQKIIKGKATFNVVEV